MENGFGKRWSVAAAASFMNACQTGTFFFTPTTLMPTIVDKFSIPLQFSTLPIAIGKVAYVFLLIPGGIIVDTVGPRLSVLVGLSILAVCIALYATFVSSLSFLIFFHIIIAASAAVSGVPVYSIFIAQWFNRTNMGLAMGFVLAGYSAAGILVPMILSIIADHHGWRFAMACMAANLFLVALPIAYFFLHENNTDQTEDNFNTQILDTIGNDDDDNDDIISVPLTSTTDQFINTSNNSNVQTDSIVHTTQTSVPPLASISIAPLPPLPPSQSQSQLQQQQSLPQTPSVLAPSPSQPPSLAAPLSSPPPSPEHHKSWAFFGIAFSYLLLQYCNGCFFENIMFFLTVDRNMSLSSASVYFSTLNFAAFFAKLVGGHLGDRYNRFNVATAASAIASLGIASLFLASPGLDEHYLPQLTTNSFPILMFSILYGFGYGASFNSLYALVPIIFGTKNLGRMQSSLFGIGLCGNAVGSVLTSVLRSKFDSYQRSFLVALVACIGNFISFNLTRMSVNESIVEKEEENVVKDLQTEDQQQQMQEGYIEDENNIPVAISTTGSQTNLIGSASGYFTGGEGEDDVNSESGGSRKIMTPIGSFPNLYNPNNFSSENLMAVSSTPTALSTSNTRLHATPSTLSFLNADTPDISNNSPNNNFGTSPSTRYILLSRQQQFSQQQQQYQQLLQLQQQQQQQQQQDGGDDNEDSGMIPDQGGFPIPRDWSFSSLRRTTPSVTDLTVPILPPAVGSTSSNNNNVNDNNGNSGVSGSEVKKSTTMEAMIDSGILSASLETVGYLGQNLTVAGNQHQHIRRRRQHQQPQQPPRRAPSLANLGSQGYNHPQFVQSYSSNFQPYQQQQPLPQQPLQHYGATGSVGDNTTPGAASTSRSTMLQSRLFKPVKNNKNNNDDDADQQQDDKE